MAVVGRVLFVNINMRTRRGSGAYPDLDLAQPRATSYWAPIPRAFQALVAAVVSPFLVVSDSDETPLGCALRLFAKACTSTSKE